MGALRELVQLQYNFIPEMEMQRLQEHLLVARPLMSAAELADGYSALSIDLNSKGAPLTEPSCWSLAISIYIYTSDVEGQTSSCSLQLRSLGNTAAI